LPSRQVSRDFDVGHMSWISGVKMVR